jgi:hypothetical protein
MYLCPYRGIGSNVTHSVARVPGMAAVHYLLFVSLFICAVSNFCCIDTELMKTAKAMKASNLSSCILPGSTYTNTNFIHNCHHDVLYFTYYIFIF